MFFQSLRGLSSPFGIGGLGVCGVLWTLRKLIQGFWFDRHYVAKKPISYYRPCVALVTGANSGIGFAACKRLMEMGVGRIVLACRDERRGETALAALRKKAPSGTVLELRLVDAGSIRSIEAFCDGLLRGPRALARLDFLLLNAGVATDAPADVPEGKMPALCRRFVVNYLGHFHMTEKLLDLMMRPCQNGACSPCIVATSSGAHRGAGLPILGRPQGREEKKTGFISSYGQSKLAQIMHSISLQRVVDAKLRTRRSARRVRFASVTPGFSRTRMTNMYRWDATPIGALRLAGVGLLGPLYWYLSRSARTGAGPIVMALDDEETVRGGEYVDNCYVTPAEGENGIANDVQAQKELREFSLENCKKALMK